VAIILVVDDEPDIRLLTKLNLERDGHTILTAANGEEALEAVREAPPDVPEWPESEKLQDDKAVVHHATRATAQMWIEQPLDRDQEKKGTKGSWLNRAFDTHPPLDERIAALKAM